MAEAKKGQNRWGKTPGDVVILPCSCQSKYQDERYGAGLRVHNVGATNASCTVCGVKK